MYYASRNGEGHPLKIGFGPLAPHLTFALATSLLNRAKTFSHTAESLSFSFSLSLTQVAKKAFII